MTDKRYEYIAVIAQYGSILKASEKLYITASALSKYVQNLEQMLDVKLFDRVGKRFVLTYAGERYLDWMTRISNIGEEMISELQDIAHANAGRIRVGVQMSRFKIVIERVLTRFFQCYPNVKIELYEDSSNAVWKMLEDNALDLALVPKETDNVHICMLPLTSSHLVLVTPPDTHLQSVAVHREGFLYPWVDLNMCREERFVAPYPSQDAYRPFEEIRTRYGFKPKIVLQTKSIGTMLFAVSCGIGSTISKNDIVSADSDYRSLRLFSYGDVEDAYEYILAYHKDHHLDTPSNTFIQLCQEAFATV